MKKILAIFSLCALISACPVKAQAALFANDSSTEIVSNDNASQSGNIIIDSSADKDKKKKDKIDLNEEFFIALAINILAIFILVGLIYFPNCGKYDVMFTFFMFNISIFLLTFLLNEIKISMGAAFGLFAVFSMLRYRTEGISMKDMTYLFIVIAMGLMNAIGLEYHEMAIINGILIVITFILDSHFTQKHSSKVIQYENIDLIKPEKYAEMIEDLKNKTGLNIYKASIKKINFLKDSAFIEIFYRTDNKKIKLKKEA